MRDSNGFRQGLGIAFRLGTEMTVATLLGAFMGYGADRVFNTKPWGLAIGVILGGAGGMLNVYRAAMEMTREMEKEDQENKDQDNSNGPGEIK